jgi:hypothetical protein
MLSDLHCKIIQTKLPKRLFYWIIILIFKYKKKLKIKVMKNKKYILELLKQSIIETDEMFEKRLNSPAYIVGWLQGTIKQVIEELEKQS